MPLGETSASSPGAARWLYLCLLLRAHVFKLFFCLPSSSSAFSTYTPADSSANRMDTAVGEGWLFCSQHLEKVFPPHLRTASGNIHTSLFLSFIFYYLNKFLPCLDGQTSCLKGSPSSHRTPHANKCGARGMCAYLSVSEREAWVGVRLPLEASL